MKLSIDIFAVHLLWSCQRGHFWSTIWDSHKATHSCNGECPTLSEGMRCSSGHGDTGGSLWSSQTNALLQYSDKFW